MSASDPTPAIAGYSHPELGRIFAVRAAGPTAYKATMRALNEIVPTGAYREAIVFDWARGQPRNFDTAIEIPEPTPTTRTAVSKRVAQAWQENTLESAWDPNPTGRDEYIWLPPQSNLKTGQPSSVFERHLEPACENLSRFGESAVRFHRVEPDPQATRVEALYRFRHRYIEGIHSQPGSAPTLLQWIAEDCPPLNTEPTPTSGTAEAREKARLNLVGLFLDACLHQAQKRQTAESVWANSSSARQYAVI
ncbi:hypothetical protein [Thioalkalivibrio sp. ALE16]|uniref:hypothetical protein n=1 Tax=Thioalkalivibrio sp. ALE16 TaxID=1158172 RepID=UPI00036AA140|nr:hypothetical protein [Thioalkalivibrio sp. ALE16]